MPSRVNAATQAADPRSVLNLYRALLALRRAEPALQGGAQRFLDAGDPDVLAYARGERFLVLANFASRPRASRPRTGARILVSTGLDRAAGALRRRAARQRGAVISRTV